MKPNMSPVDMWSFMIISCCINVDGLFTECMSPVTELQSGNGITSSEITQYWEAPRGYGLLNIS